MPSKYEDLGLGHIATLSDPTSGRSMRVFTTEVGVQVYTTNFLPKSEDAAPHDVFRAVCLETENFPNAINDVSTFPAAVREHALLQAGATYRHVTIHEFAW